MPLRLTARAGLPALYKHYRARGYGPRSALGSARHLIEVDRWLKTEPRHAYLDNGGEVSVWTGDALPEGEFRDGLAALDPDLARWTVEVTTTADWDFAEGAEVEATNSGMGVWWSDEDPDDLAAKLEPGDDDPRPHGGLVHYASTGLTRSHRWCRETLYLYNDPDDARKHYAPKGTARGLVDLVAKERAGEQAEAFAAYLGRKYDDRVGEPPLHVAIEIRWDNEVVGEASCGGYDPDPDATNAALDALLSSDLLDEALAYAKDWCDGALRRRNDAAAEALTAARKQFGDSLDDSLAGAKNLNRRLPAAAYKEAP